LGVATKSDRCDLVVGHQGANHPLDSELSNASRGRVVLSALFLWDVWIVNQELSRIAKMSHDEVGFLGEIASSSAGDWMDEFLLSFGR
jgi:hypothetical protein